MKSNSRNITHYIFLLLITGVIIIIGNFIALLFLMRQWTQVMPVSKDYVLDNLTCSSSGYVFSSEGKAYFEKEKLFGMIIDNEGQIIWSEQLPEQLNRKYTMQDVAVFTRYYLDNYPVHTYIVDEGLLIIGGPKDSIWKYTLEYDNELVRTVLTKNLPIYFVANIIILITVPLIIQRKWVRRKEVERTEWIAGVSHDIRTPLTLIIGNSDYIKENSDSITVSSKAEVIEKQGLRIKALVTNLNMSNKLSYGVGNYKKNTLAISQCLRKVVADIINREPGEQYSFNLDIDNELSSLEVSLNEELFTRMLENLINNSISHNPDGCNILISLKKEKKNFILNISDDGNGATKELYKKLNSKKFLNNPKLGEHGIGLRVVEQIISFHKWTIKFTPNEETGFRITISGPISTLHQLK